MSAGMRPPKLMATSAPVMPNSEAPSAVASTWARQLARATLASMPNSCRPLIQDVAKLPSP